MRILATLFLATSLFSVAGRADEKTAAQEELEAKVVAQKKTALRNWESVDAGPEAVHETKHLIVVAPKAMSNRLKDVGFVLEKAHDLALRPLAFEKDQERYPGKIAVYLFPKAENLRSFIRRVEKRRLEGEEFGSHSATDEVLHAAAAPGKTAGDLSVEGQAAAQLAAVLLVRRAGDKVPVAHWLIEGFGRATWYRASPFDRITANDRRMAARLAGRKSVKDVYGGLVEAAEAPPLRGTLADYLAYGPTGAKFPALLKGFEPEENGDSKTTEQALEAAGIKWDAVDRGWKVHVTAGR